MLRLLHLADLHLGWFPSFLPDAQARGWQQERDRRLEDAVAWALDPAHGVDLVVIAGDLFESHAPDEALVARVVSALRRLQEAGTGVVTVPGNHDEITYPNSVYRAWADRWPGLLVQNANPEALGPVAARGKAVYVYSCAYTGGVTRAWPPVDAFPPRAADSGYHIGVFHGTLMQDDAGANPLAHDRSLPLAACALGQAGYDYVALGHIHRHEEQRAGSTLAVYCGAPDGKGFDDPGVGFYTMVEVERGRAAVERVGVLTRRIQTVDV
ncbi:MAG: DNA repair exonuclease, partial [Bacillota bacterium]